MDRIKGVYLELMAGYEYRSGGTKAYIAETLANGSGSDCSGSIITGTCSHDYRCGKAELRSDILF